MARILTEAELKSVEGLSSRKAAEVLGVGKTTINEAREILRSGGTLEPEDSYRPKILTYDIETKPNLVYTWGLWNQNIGLNQIVEPGGMMCFAAKWLGEDEVIFASDYEDGHAGMVRKLHDLLSEADIVVGYNSDNYDNKKVNTEFALAKLGPTKPYKSIDLIKTNRKRFDFASRKLDYIAQQLEVGAKVKHEGFDLWTACMAGDPEAWAKMREYNVGDVIVTEDLYKELQPWLFAVPHYGMWTIDDTCCAYCGNTKLTPSGYSRANVTTYDLFKCDHCGGWNRGTQRYMNSLTTRAVG